MLRWGVGLKALSLLMLLNVRGIRKVPNRHFAVDLVWIYASTYTFLLSNIVGIHKAWPKYAGSY